MYELFSSVHENVALGQKLISKLGKGVIDGYTASIGIGYYSHNSKIEARIMLLK